MPRARPIAIEPLTASGFAPFGAVIETARHQPISINQGFAERFNDLAPVDVSSENGATNLSLFTTRVRPFPIAIKLMERHPLGTQAFIPMQDKPWLVLVCGDPGDDGSYRCFRATGRQGVSYGRNVWHHPLLVLEDGQYFVIVDRKGPGNNLEEVWRDDNDWLYIQP